MLAFLANHISIDIEEERDGKNKSGFAFGDVLCFWVTFWAICSQFQLVGVLQELPGAMYDGSQKYALLLIQVHEEMLLWRAHCQGHPFLLRARLCFFLVYRF